MRLQLKLLLTLCTGILFAIPGKAQTKLGNNPGTIDPASLLELENPNKALFLTRVSLVTTSDITTVPNPKAGMVVFNNNPAIFATNTAYTASGVGLYYYDGGGWVYSGIGTFANFYWSLNGNANAVDGTNFLGTTNNVALNFRVNNIKAGRLDLQGNTSYGYQAANNQAVGLLNNTLIGAYAGSGITSGSSNTAIGNSSLLNTGLGYNNSALGYKAGANFADAHDNTFLGNLADITGPGINNATAIGSGAQVSASNSVVLGNSAANVGIGNTAPTNKLHVTGANPLRLEGLQGIVTSDSVLTTDANGVVKKISTAAVINNIKANNGLTRNNDSVQLGGTLTKVTNIVQNGNALNFSGGSVTIGGNTTVTGNLRVNGNDTTSGASVAGNFFTPGNTRTNTLTATGLTTGGANDSLLNINNGVVSKVSPTAIIGNIKADNGLTRVGDSIELGGTLKMPTTVNQNNNNLAFTNGTVTIGGNTTITGNTRTNGNDTTTGATFTNTLAVTNAAVVGGTTTIGGNTTINANLRTNGNDTTTGANVAGNFATAGNTRTSTLTATGLTTGGNNDSLLNINNGVVSKVAPSAIIANIRANNGLTRNNDSVQLGGTLTKATNVAQNGNALSFTGGKTTIDSLAVNTNATVGGNATVTGATNTGTLTTVGTATIGGNTTVNGNVRTNGNDTTTGANVAGNFATTGNTRSGTLTATGLGNGNAPDSLLNINNGVVSKISPAAIIGNIKANNGLTRNNDSIQLGGTLTMPTNINQAGNNFSVTNGNVGFGTTTPANNTEFNYNNVGGGTNGETQQGVNVLTTNSATAPLAIGLRSRMTVTNAATEVRASSSALNVNNAVSGAAAAGYFNSSLRAGGSLGTGVNLTAVSADAVMSGGTANNQTAVIGGRFNGNASSTATRSVGVLAIAEGSTTLNVGLIGATTSNPLTIAGSLPAGTNAGVLGVSGTGAATDYAGYFSGSVVATGNVGIGANNNAPTNALHVNGTNPLRLQGLQPVGSADSLLTKDATGVVKTVNASAIIANVKADNGLTRVGDSIELGGTLKMPTTIAQNGNPLNFNGGTVTIGGNTTVNGNIRVNGNDTTSGANVAGNFFTPGNTRTSTLTATGLTTGGANDSLLNINNGVVSKVSTTAIIGNIKADNGLTRVGDSIELGGTLKMPTTVNQAGNALNFAGGAVTIGGNTTITGNTRINGNDTTTGATSTNTLAVTNAAVVGGTTTIGGNTTINANLRTNGNDTTTGANVAGNFATTGNTRTSTLTATGLTTGGNNDSLLNINNGVVSKVSPSAIIGNIKADNGLTRVGDSIELGGTLKMPTTVNQAGNALNFAGGAVTIGGNTTVTGNTRINGNDTTTGATSTNTLAVTNAAVVGGTTTIGGNTTINANLRTNGNDTTTGMNVAGNFATTGNTRTSTLTATGLTTGGNNDSLLNINNGVVSKVSPSAIIGNIKADNGLTRVGDSIELGGTLKMPTTVNQAGNALNFAGGAVTIGGNTTITGNTRINGNDTTTGATSTNTLAVTNAAVVGGTTTIGGNTTINANLRTNGNDTTTGANVAGNFATTGNTRTSTLTATGLTTGGNNDSLLNINNGVVSKVSPSAIIGNIKADNGLTRVGDSIELGGTLKMPTTVNQAGNALNFAGGAVTIGGNTTVNGNVRTNGNDTTSGANTAGNFYTPGNTTTSSLTATGLAAGVATDSILTINPANNVVRKASLNTLGGVTTASNGLVKNGNDIQLGGPLTQNTTIPTNGFNITLNGLGGLNVNSLLNAGTLAVSNGASVGQNLVVTGTTNSGNFSTIGTTTTAALTATSIFTGAASNDLLNITPGGVVQRTTPASIIANIKADNGLTRVGDSIELGGTLKMPTTVNQNNNNLAFTNGTVTIGGNTTITGNTRTNGNDTTTGATFTNTLAVTNAAVVGGTTTIGGNTTINANLRTNGNDTTTGANVAGNFATAGNTRTSTLTATGLTTGGNNDSLLNINNGVVSKVSPSAIIANIRANNGLTRNNDSVQLGGTLTKATNVAQNGNALSFTGGKTTIDSLAVNTNATVGGNATVTGATNTGTLTTVGTATIGGNTFVNGNVRTNGNDTTTGANVAGNFATTGNTRTGTLTATGLGNGNAPDSLLNINNGIVSKISPAAIIGNIKANNGLTRNNDSIQLGGTLTMPTNINQAGNNFSVTNGNVGFGTTTPANNTEFNYNNVGGGTNGETQQGVNVLTTNSATAPLAIGLRSRMVVANPGAEVRASSSALNVNNSVSGAAAAGYFNSSLRAGGSLGTGVNLTAVSADAVMSGGTANNQTAVIGGRFGGNASSTATRSVGVLAIAEGSTTLNVGLIGATTSNPLTIAGSLPAGTNAGVLGVSGTGAATDYAGYFNGSVVATGNVGIGANNNTPTNALHVRGINPVRLEGVQGIAATDSLLTKDGTGVVKSVSAASVVAAIRANNGLTRNNDSIQLGGTLTHPTGIDQGGNTLTFSNGNIAIGGNTNTSGTATAGNLTTTGATTTGTLGASGNATIGGTLGVTGATTIGGTLGVTGTTTSGNFTTTGNTTTGTLTATALPVGTTTDSLVTIDPVSGNVHRIAINRIVGTVQANNGLSKSGDTVQLGGTLNKNTTIAGGNFNTTITTSSATQSAALNVNSTPGNTIAAGTELFSINNTITGNSTGAGTTTLRAQYNNAQSNSNNTRVNGSLNEASAGGTGLGAGGTPQATGATGLADYTGASDAPTTDFIVGLRGAAYTASNRTNGLNVVGVNFGGTYFRSVGGYFFPGAGSVANLGTVGQIGGTENQAWNDAVFNGKNAGVVAINYNAPTLNDLALYTRGNVQMDALPTGLATDDIVTIDPANNIVKRTTINTLGAVTTASNGVIKVGNDVRLGGSLTANTAIATAGNSLSLTGTGNLNVDSAVNAGELNVGHNAVITGNASAANLTTAGATTTGTLGASGNATIGGTLGVTGGTTIGGTLGVTGATTIGSTLGVTGTTTSGNFTTTGNTTTGTLTATALPVGTTTDSLVTIDPVSGNVHRIAINRIVGTVQANNGLSKSGDTVQLGGTLNKNTTIAGGNFNTTITTSSATQSAALNVNSTPGNTIAAGTELFSINNTITGNSTGAGTTTLRAQYNNAQSNSNNTRVNGSLNEASAGGTGLGAGGTPQATGATGLADYTGASDAPTTDFIVGLRGAAYTASNRTNGLNVVGVNFGGTYFRSVGGYFFPGAGSVANLGTVGQIGGTENQAWNDAVFNGKNAGVVAINYNAPTLNDLALYTRGNVQMDALPTGLATDNIVTIDPVTNIVKRTTLNTLGGITTASNGLSKVGNDVQLGGTLTHATTVDQNNNALNFTNGDIAIGGNTITTGTATAGNLTTAGATNTGTFVATGASTTTGITNAGNIGTTTLSTTGAATVGTTLGVTGNTTIGGTLGVTGATTIGSTLGVTGTTTSGNFTTTGNTTTGTLAATALTGGADPTDSVLTIDAAGVVHHTNVTTISPLDNWKLTGNAGTTPANFIGTTDAQQFAIRTNNVQRALYRADGTILMGNSTIPGYIDNKYEIDLANVGGATTAGEQNQGVNVLANALTGANLSVAMRARNNVNAGNTVASIRGLQGNVGIDGTAGAATAGFFDAVLRTGGALTANAILTGVGADAEATGGTVAASNYFIGGRFGANSLNALAARSIGVLATGNNSTNLNIGSYGLANDPTFAGFGGLVAGQASGFSAGVVAQNGDTVGNHYALYTQGKVRLNNVPTGALTDSILTQDPTTNVVRRTTITSLGGITTASNGLTKVGNDVQLGGTLNKNTTIAGGNFNTTITTSSATQSAALNVNSTPGNTIAAGTELFSINNTITGNSTGAGTTTLRAQYNNAQSNSNNTRVNGSLNEASAGGTGLGAGGTPQATGATGLADYTGASDAPTTDFIVGLRGAAYTASNRTNGLNVVGVNFGGTYFRSVGGYFFPGAGSVANLGTVGQIGGTENQAWNDAVFNGKNAGVVAINYNAPTLNDLALYTRGNVQMDALPTGLATDNIVTIDPVTNIVKRTTLNTLGGITTASNGLSKVGNDVQLGGALTGNTTIDGGTFTTNITGNNNGAAARVLNVANNVTTAIPAGSAPYATSTSMNYNGTESTGTLATTTGGLYSVSATSAGDVQAQGALLEAQSSGGNGDYTHAVGGFGLVTGNSTTATAQARVIGLSGATNFPGTGNNFNGIGVSGYNAFSGNATLGRSAGGAFNGTGGATEFGVIGQVGGSRYQTFYDAAFVNKHIAVAAVNDNAAGANQLALYSAGAVQMTGLTGTGTNLLTIDGTGIVGTTPAPAAITASNGAVRVGNDIQVNHAFANTFTAAQTFSGGAVLPATAAQGNNLISSVNAGTAGTVAAAQIGNGLTDAQVADALTINGGNIVSSPISSSPISASPISASAITSSTINGSQIGATSPATGAFTTLNSSGATVLGSTTATALNNTPIGATTRSTSAFTAVSVNVRTLPGTGTNTVAADDYLIIIGSGAPTTFTLPTTGTTVGRTIIIKNLSGNSVTTNGYIGLSGSMNTALVTATNYMLIYDGNNWQNVSLN